MIMPVMDAEKEKTALSVEEIEEMHEKIQQNRRENAEFAERLDKYLSDPEKEISPITIGGTPNSLAISGANAELPVIINPSTVKKCMSEPEKHYHGHGLSSEIMKQLPDELRNPAMIFKGSKDNSLVAITELKDKNNHGIMVAVSLNEMKNHHEVNRISSVYGKDNLTNYLKTQISQGNLVAANIKKADRMFQTIGLQLPREETFISFDNSIAYSTANVKSPSEIFSEVSHQKTNEKLLPVLNAVHQKHEDKIESLAEKIAVREDKIAKNTAKIDKLTAKIDRLKDTNKMLDGLSNGVLSAPVKAIAERNQRRIERLERVRIPKREAKIQQHLDRISTLEHKSEVSHAKADKLAALSGVIKSFAVRDPAERRLKFTQNMDALHDAAKRALSFKADKCTRQLKSLTERYAAAESSVDRLNLSEKISSIQSRKQSLTERMKRLDNLQKPFSEHTPEQVDKLMIHTESSIEKAAENQNVTLSNLAENTVVNSADYLRNAELSDFVNIT